MQDAVLGVALYNMDVQTWAAGKPNVLDRCSNMMILYEISFKSSVFIA